MEDQWRLNVLSDSGFKYHLCLFLSVGRCFPMSEMGAEFAVFLELCAYLTHFSLRDATNCTVTALCN